MLLLTDGTVMCHEYLSPNWYRLTPDATGSYVNGKWSTMAPLPNNPSIPTGQGGPLNAPLYFASAVLKDGRVFVAGGEYNYEADQPGLAGLVWLNAAAIYNPLLDSWTNIPFIPAVNDIGDASCCVFPDGRLMVGPSFFLNSVAQFQSAYIFDPTANTNPWTAAGANGAKGDPNSEETWTLLPDGSILVAEVTNQPATQRYIISLDKWVADASIPSGHGLVDTLIGEIGPAILMPDGKVFAIGATSHTDVYTPPADVTQQGSWAPGPDFPQLGPTFGNPLGAADAPACLLPNGKVFCVVGEIQGNAQNGFTGPPLVFYEFDGANLNPATGTANPNIVNNAPTYTGRMLLLPTGQVLYATTPQGFNQQGIVLGPTSIEVYNPDGAPDPSWAPTITTVATSLYAGGTFELVGTQLNGLSQACCYGDDASMATNYPLVRIRNVSEGNVTYLRTHDHSTMAVATGSTPQSTMFDVPLSIRPGAYELVVVANGIPSAPVAVTISPSPWVIDILASMAVAGGGWLIIGGADGGGLIGRPDGTIVPIPIWDPLNSFIQSVDEEVRSITKTRSAVSTKAEGDLDKA